MQNLASIIRECMTYQFQQQQICVYFFYFCVEMAKFEVWGLSGVEG